MNIIKRHATINEKQLKSMNNIATIYENPQTINETSRRDGGGGRREIQEKYGLGWLWMPAWIVGRGQTW